MVRPLPKRGLDAVAWFYASFGAMLIACSAPATPTAVQTDDLDAAPYAAPDYGVEHVDRQQGERICLQGGDAMLRRAAQVAAARWHAILDRPFELLCHEPTIRIAWGDPGDGLVGHAYWTATEADLTISPDVPARKLIPVVTHEIGHALSPVEGAHHHDGPGILGSPWTDEITDADVELIEGRRS